MTAESDDRSDPARSDERNGWSADRRGKTRARKHSARHLCDLFDSHDVKTDSAIEVFEQVREEGVVLLLGARSCILGAGPLAVGPVPGGDEEGEVSLAVLAGVEIELVRARDVLRRSRVGREATLVVPRCVGGHGRVAGNDEV